MALSKSRIFDGGETQFPWERAAIDFVLAALPDTDPHLAWPLQELMDPSSGRLYEIDLLVLARSGLFLIEIKSHPGALTGDARDWTFTEPGGKRRHLDCPYSAANHKAKVLASLLDRELGPDRPFINALIFVSHETADIKLTGGRPEHVVDRGTIRQTLVHGLSSARGRVVNRPMMRRLHDALRKLGVGPSQKSRIVGGYRLEKLVDELEGYQEHNAVSTTVASDTARVRSYLVPRATTVERGEQLMRAARREAELLSRLGHHPNILNYRGFQEEGPLGPAVIFEPFDGGLPLHLFLKQEPDLSFDERLGVLQNVVEAIDHCHRADFLHRNLSPSSVLARRGERGIEIRVHRFQAAAEIDHTSFGTQHVDQLAEELDRLYQAPEVIRDPRQAGRAADLFSIGCLGWLLFTGQHPAATLREREESLSQQGGLRLAGVRDDLAVLDTPFALATEPRGTIRSDDVLGWFNDVLLDELTRPAKVEQLDPYQAEKGAVLDGRFVVERLLGSGATARVLKVTRLEDGRAFALKVAHDEGCQRRLLDEARVLEKLKRHDSIVGLEERLTIGDRTCLLLQFAGEQSLADELRAHGGLSLDAARRYGEDLLRAVHYLEEQGITHRDIKPGNLGFTTLSKKAVHLTLFDFSLAASDRKAVSAGTPDWRDPWLHVRGSWDAAADRFAAAAVLHAMVSGVRPEFADAASSVRIEAERFDAAVRDHMKAFFERCFKEDAGERFPSAEAMLAQWDDLFVTRSDKVAEATITIAPALALEDVTPATLVEALSFSARARNALDRAGVVSVADLLRLPDNLLTAIRGVGHAVAQEILDVASLLRERLSVDPAPQFVPNYGGPRLGLAAAELGLAEKLHRRLLDAGILSTIDLARSAAIQVSRLLGEAGADGARQALIELAKRQPTGGTLAQWVRELLPPKKERVAGQRIRLLLGLDALPGDVSGHAVAGGPEVNHVAEALGVAPQLVHASLQAMRRDWQGAACRDDLESAVREAVDAMGPACTFTQAAEHLVEDHGSSGVPAEEQVHDALALVRLTAELRPSPVHWRRIGSSAWVALHPETLMALVELANTADELAGQEPLPSSETVRTRLLRHAAGTPLEVLPPDRLVSLAARASEHAAASARMELYPRGMDAVRAIKLSLSALGVPGLTADMIRQRVRARYPEAQPLPDRPELDDLLAPHGLRHDHHLGGYFRAGDEGASLSGTVQVPTRLTSAGPTQKRRHTAEALEAQSFEDALDRGVEAGRFRVVQVRADFADRAEALLADHLRVQSTSLDRLIWDAANRKAKEDEVDIDLLVSTDREGPGGQHWQTLRDLVEEAAGEVIDTILGDRARTRLLVHAGSLARFDLAGQLQSLSHRAQLEDGKAVVMVVPSHADGLAPSINGRLPVPTQGPGQQLTMPESWLRNAHRAPAGEGGE